MEKSKVLWAVLLLFAWVLPLDAQQNPEGETPNFYKIRQQKLDAWNGVVPPPGNGYKVFKRWEYFWRSRIYPDGSFPSPDHNEKEWAHYLKEHPSAANDIEFLPTWSSLGPNSSPGGYNGIGRINCIATHPTDPNTLWVGTPAGGLWKSVNGGATWTTNTDNLVSVMALGVSSIAISSSTPNTMYIATGDKDSGNTLSVGILKSTDGGGSWSPTGNISATLIYEVVVHPTNNNVVLAATSNGLYRSTNAGGSWTQVLSNSTFYDLKFKPGSSTMAYAVSNDKFYRSTDGGISWTQMGNAISGSGRMQIAVTPANAAFIGLVSSRWNGSFNGFYSSTNSGGSFGLKYSGPKNLLNGDPNGDSSGGNGQGTYDLCITISPTNTNEIFIGGVNLWKSNDSGVSWNLANYWQNFGNPGVPTVHADKHCMVWQNNNTLFQGNDGGIYKSTNAGNSWTDLSNTLVISQIYRIGVSKADSKVIAGLQDNSTKLKGTLGVWTEAKSTGDGMENFIHPSNPNILYCSSYYGNFSRSANGGGSWDAINSHNQQGDWITPWTLDPNNPSILYAGFKDVWKSTNEGATWTTISNNLSSSNLLSLVVAPSNSNIIYTSNGGTIWKSTNGGAPWTNITAGLPSVSISYIAVDPVDANKVYVTLSGLSPGSKVFKSTNGGNSWTNISGSLPNVSANCITVQPGGNDALYVGTDLGVFYRSASNNDWILFNNGLPVVLVYELECKASTGKITAATYGRGLWESDFFSGSSTNLTVTPSTHNVSPVAGSVTFNVSSNGNWTVSDNASWLNCTPASGNGNGSFQATYSANTGPLLRTAIITVSGPGGSPTATVVQSGTGGSVCNTPTGLQTTNITLTSATFRWDAVSGASNYSFQYRTLPNGTWSNPITSLSVTYTVSSFQAGNSYEWRVRSNCSNGLTSAWSNALTFVMPPPPNCPAPTTLITSDITNYSVIASWDPVPGALTYQLQTRRVPNGPWVDTNPAIFSSTTIFIYGFDPGTWYEWRVRANCANGFTSAWADGIPFRTDFDTCEAPEDLYVSSITQNTCTLNWSAVPDALNYTVQFYDYGLGQWYNLGGPPATGTTLSLYGLWANFQYTWRVITNCVNGSHSDPSVENTFFADYAPDCQIGSQWPTDDLYPSSSWQYVTLMFGGDYSVFNVNGGTTYTFSFCPTNNGVLNFDGEIYLRSAGGTVIAHTDDDCGLAPKLVWRAGFTGQVQVLLAEWQCLANASNNKMAYRIGSSFTDEPNDRSEESDEIRAYALEPIPPSAQNKATGSGSIASSGLEMTVYPNPASGDFKVQLDAGVETFGSAVITVYSPQGRIVWENAVPLDKGLNTWEIKTQHWPTGMYLVQLLNEQGIQCSRKIYIAK